MMTLIPTRRRWLDSLRLGFAVVLLATGCSALLLLSGIDARALACVVSLS